MTSFRSSDEELARRLQFEEQQQQQQQSQRNIGPPIDNTTTTAAAAAAAAAGRNAQQEQQDMALARQYSQMYLDERVGGQQHQQTMSSQQNSYNHHNGASINSCNHPNNLQQRSTTRSKSGFFEMNGRDSNNHIGYSNIGMSSANHHHHHHIQQQQQQRQQQHPYGQNSFRDPFDYSSDINFGTSNDGGRKPAPEQYPVYNTSPRKKECIDHHQNHHHPPYECHPGRYAEQQHNSEQQNNSTSSSTAVVTAEVDRDLELARRMQDLEDLGLGHRNSERKNNEDLAVTTSTSIDRNTHTTTNNNNNHNNNHHDDFETVARLLSESGTDVNEIPDEVLCELLGSGNGKPSAVTSMGSNNKANHNFFNDRATHDNRNSLPLPKKSVSMRTPPSQTGMLKDFDPTPAMDIIIPTDANHPSKTNKGKRRGMFGFAMADKNKFNLDEITMDAPTTTLAPVLSTPATAPTTTTQPTPTNLVAMEQTIDRRIRAMPSSSFASVTAIPSGVVPAAIPPPPGRSLVRSISPMPQPRGPVGTSSIRNPGVPPAAIPPPSIPSGIPSAIPPKPVGMMSINQSFNGLYRGTNICSACGLSHGTFLKVLDRKYHPECFRCTSCNGRIDMNDQFKYTTDEKGKVHPHHRECFKTFGVQCCVCQQKVPVTPDGRVPYIKHPFFSTEVMCVRHADENIRRCCGCQRLEPFNKPFIDLMDEDRCVCPSCCQSAVVDSSEAKPLWNSVLTYMEQQLKLPIWGPLRNVPILMVGVQSLEEQMSEQGCIHGATSQIHGTTSQNLLATGLCVTEQGRQNNSYTQSSHASNIVAILCPTGLPRALVAGILAHESIHAWIQLHPNYYTGRPLSSQVVEGLCQLVASLYLSDGVIPNSDTSSNKIDASSEKKLRQYYKFCIERDQSDIYGTGYRRAAAGYRDIGMEGLVSHVLEYRDFPHTDTLS